MEQATAAAGSDREKAWQKTQEAVAAAAAAERARKEAEVLAEKEVAARKQVRRAARPGLRNPLLQTFTYSATQHKESLSTLRTSSIHAG